MKKAKSMKKAGLIFLLILASLCWIVSVYSQEDMTEIDNSAFENPRRSSAIFNHDAHNEQAGVEECNACHHVYDEDGTLTEDSSEDQSCSDCHELKDVGSKPGLMKAYHLNCKGCHSDQKAGPVLCGECHLNK